jgi:putative ABC transport system permease protein
VINLIRYVCFRHLRHKKLRALLTLLGVAVGIALFSSILLINKATLSAFKENVTAVSGQTDIVISGGKTGFPEDRLEIVGSLPEVKSAVPVIEENARLMGLEPSEPLNILGVDLLRESSVRSYKLSDSQIMDDPLIFLNQPDSMIISKTIANRYGLKIDSKIKLSTARGIKTFIVRGLIEPEGAARAYGGSIAIMDIDAVRYSFGRENNLDAIDVVLRDKTTTAEVINKLRTLLGPGYNVEPPQNINTDKLVGVFQKILTLIASLALLVGLLLVANTSNVSVFERRREIGILRSLGATRTGIFVVFITEAAILGFLGSLLGAVGGVWLAHALVGTIAETLTSQSLMQIPKPEIHFAAADIVTAVILGVFTSALAAVWPSYKANRIQPVDAMRALPQQAPSPNPRLSFASLLLVLPFCVNIVATLIAKILRLVWPDIAIRLSQDNLKRDFNRTVGNVLTLMLGLNLVVVIAIINVSFQESISSWIDRALRADLIISSTGPIFSLQTQPLHEDLGGELSAAPEIKQNLAVAPYGMRFLHLQYEERTIAIKAYDNPGAGSRYSFLDVTQGKAEDAGAALFDEKQNTIAISQNFADHFHKTIGDDVTLDSPSGSLPLKVVAIINDFSSNEGVVYFSRAVYKKYWRDPLVNIFYMRLNPGVDAAALRHVIDQKFGVQYGLQVLLNGELKSEFKTHIDRSFAYSKAIETAALISALFAMINMLLISVMERTRELGLLRAIGMSRGQIFRMIIAESLAQGLIAGILAVIFGSLFSYIWIKLMMTKILGWTIEMYFPTGVILIAVGLGLLVSIIAALGPAHRASALQIKEALSYD